MSTSTPIDRKARATKSLAGIEFCRFLCSLAIILFHHNGYFSSRDPHVAAQEFAKISTPQSELFYSLFSQGHFAVQVFWVISGYIFFWKYGHDIHRRSVSFRKFFVFRMSRLYPLHILTLSATALLQYVYWRNHHEFFNIKTNDVVSFIQQLFMASKWLPSQPESFNEPIWSVSAEIPVYFLFYLLVRMFAPGIWLCLAVMAVTFPFHNAVVTCALFFFAGGLIQCGLERLDPRHRGFAFVGAVAVVAEIAVSSAAGLDINTASVLLLAVAVVTAFILLEGVSGRDLSRLLPLGDLTYASYLIHFPLTLALVLSVNAMGVDGSVFLSPLGLAAFLVLTYGLSWVSFHGYECPMQSALRRRWLH